MAVVTLLPARQELEFLSFAGDGERMVIHLRTWRRTVPCPDCGAATDRVHSRYTRTLGDLPWHGSTVEICLETRRFFCRARACSRRIFTERLPGTAAPYARRTARLCLALDAISLALGGEAGARLAGRLGMEVSPDTLLRRLIFHAPGAPVETPRVLGVDDWAYRKGQSYGTILLDLEQRRVIDLLPDRTSDTLAKWLTEHPGVEIIARDRSTEYSRAIRQAAPEAREVADRWHLLYNLRQSLERFFGAAHARLKKRVGSAVAGLSSDSSWRPQRRSRSEKAASEAARHQRLTRYLQVRQLHAEEGLNILQIARRLEMSRVTVRKYLSAESCPEWSAHRDVPRLLQPYEAHLDARWREGCRNARQLWREIRAQGYAGAARQVHRWAQPRREEPAKNTPHVHRKPPPALTEKKRTRFPAPRRLSWLLMRDPAGLSDRETAILELIRTGSEVEVAYTLAQRFVRMIQGQEVERLDPWLAACAESGIPALVSFAEGLRRDYAAVQAALELPWSSGQAEGQINRLKMLKRQMYGRAGFPLLRSRVLRAA
jgi:transposase